MQAYKPKNAMASAWSDLNGPTPESVLGFVAHKGRWMCEATISPEEAKALLRFNSRNRPVRQNKVKIFAELIESGRFHMTHQGIAFDTKSALLDGQHRLLGCIGANREIQCRIHFNEPEENFKYIDRLGSPRAISDDLFELRLVDAGGAKTVEAAIRILYHYDHGRAPWSNKPSLSTEVAVDVLSKHSMLVETVKFVTDTFGCRGGFPSAPLAAFGTAMREIDDSEAVQFLQRLADGTQLSPGDPILVLREGALREGARSKATRNGFMVRLVRAWNAHRRRLTVRALQANIRDDQSFPSLCK